MRSIIKPLLPLLLSVMFMLSGCMQNNGDIGDFFGTWKVTSIKVNGIEDASYQGNIFFQFQTSVVRLVENRPHNDLTEYFGAWSDEGPSTLIINFGFNVDPISEVYDIPAAARMIRGINTVTMTDRSSRKMTWTFTSGEGETVVYRLSKQ